MKHFTINVVVVSILLFCSCKGAAQNRFIDSLRIILQTKSEDTNRVNTLNELSYGLYMSSKYDSSVMCGQQALLLSEKLDFKKGKGYALIYIGCNYGDKADLVRADSFYRQASIIAHEIKDKKLIGLVYHGFGGIAFYENNFADAFKYYDSAMQYYTIAGDKRLMAFVMRVYGLMYNRQSNYPEALRYTYLSLTYFKEIGDEEKVAECYSFNGSIYKEHRNYTEALKNFNEAIGIYERLAANSGASPYNKVMLSSNISSIAEVYLLQGNRQKALAKYSDVLNEAATILRNKDSEWLADYSSLAACCYIGIGQVVEFEGDSAKESGNSNAAIVYFEQAEHNYQKSLNICQENNLEFDMPQAYISLGGINLKLFKYSAAEKWLQKALLTSTEKQLPIVQRDSYLKLSELYENTGSFDKAHDHYKKYVLYRDSIINEESIRKTEGYKMQYAFDKKEAEAKAQQEKKDFETKRVRKMQYLAIASLAILVLAILIIVAVQWRSNKQKHTANLLLKSQKERIESTLVELKSTQSQLIQSEKMASLGELTAGIAHEIQNPLNFVNNFSEVNAELIEEMVDEVKKGNKEEAISIAKDIKDNEQKINHHGKRADAIVKGMLQHSRTTGSTKEPTDINKLADEYLRLAYHGVRAKDNSFNATLKTDFDETIGKINIIPQDIGRVILNLITNAFYAVGEKKKQTPNTYEPIVSVTTKSTSPPSGGRGVRITIGDNGNGIPENIIDKIFQPFFTTKPTGQGTGLGLSLAYDIVKAHGGEMKVETKEGEGTEFIIQLPIA